MLYQHNTNRIRIINHWVKTNLNIFSEDVSYLAAQTELKFCAFLTLKLFADFLEKDNFIFV